MIHRPTAGFAVLAAALLALPAATQDLTRAEAVSMEQKIAAILERGNRAPRANAPPLRTPVSERELNAYLRFSPQVLMPPGLANPHVTIAEGGRVAARALLDLDALRKAKPRGWTDPLGYAAGTLDVVLTGMLYAANGKGVFQLQSATLGGVSLPKGLLQSLISFYTKTAEHPNGWDMDSPFTLPANIRQVEVQRGAATVIQ